MNAYSPRTIEVASPLHLYRTSLLLLLLALTGCAGRRGLQLPPLTDWETRRSVLAEVSAWEFHGRIGVRAGDDGFNGNLRWWQKGDLFIASVSGPFGVGTVRIQGDGDTVTVTDSDGKVTELTDVEPELRALYGWTIPVRSLRFWALGIPDPSAPARTEFGDDGLLTGLQQRHWNVSIGGYREGGGQLVPRQLTAVNRDTRVRLVIDDWTFY